MPCSLLKVWLQLGTSYLWVPNCDKLSGQLLLEPKPLSWALSTLRYLFVNALIWSRSEAFFSPPETGEVLGWSTSEDEQLSLPLDPFKGCLKLTLKRSPQNNLSATVPAWPTHIQNICEWLESTEELSHAARGRFWRIKLYFFCSKNCIHMFRSVQPSPHVFVSKQTCALKHAGAHCSLRKKLRGFFLNLELCKHHLKAIYILHLSLLLTGASAGRDVQCAAVIYDLASTFDLGVKWKPNKPPIVPKPPPRQW